MNMRNFYRLVVLLLSVLLVSLLFACELKDTGKDKNKLKIGVIAPFSGDKKNYGENGLLGIELALAYYQDLHPRTIVSVIKRDDRDNPELGKEAFISLAENEGVAVVLVLSDSRTMLAISEIADQYETPIVAAVSSHPDITASSWVSQMIFDDNVQGTVAALFVIDELLIEKVAVARDADDPHSVALADQFIDKYSEAGGTVVTADLTGDSDNYDDLVAHLQKNSIKFVYLPVKAAKVIEFQRASKRSGFRPQVMVSDGILSLMVLEYAKDISMINGMLATDVFSTAAPLTDFGRAVRSKFKEMHAEQTITTIAASSCEATIAVMAAVDQCGDDPEKGCINAMLKSSKEIEGFLGPIMITSDGKAERPVFINKIKNKELKFLLKVY